MDSGEDGRSLPGRMMGMPKWMRLGDKSDFMDACAASPPADGFFFANQPRMNKQQQTAIGGCVRDNEQQKNEMGQIIPKVPNVDPDSEIACSNTHSTSAFYRSFAPASNFQSQNGRDKSEESEGTSTNRKVLNMNSHELEKWAKNNIQSRSGTELEVLSAETPADDLQITRRIPSITKKEEGGTLRLVEKMGTPDVTPCNTPGVTPACSPQVLRKSGNPFFSGDMNRKEDGSWLFRPGPKNVTNSSLMYEAKVDIQQADSSQSTTKTTRYVPRPSQLRELNFWSPTSM